ncbi:MAG: bacillithiol biosynthesis BshC [Myxococcota bacterium]
MTLRAFGAAFFARDDAVRPFVAPVEALDELSASPPAAAVLHELERQNPGRTHALAEPGSIAVVTGQQVGLFGGPAYSVHKALTAVFIARALRARGQPATPIFWLQVEDHDLHEVEGAVALDASGAPIDLRPQRSLDVRERISLAHRSVDKAVAASAAKLADVIEAREHGADVAALIRAAYTVGASYADAFRRVLDAATGEELLFFDPRTPAVAELLRPLHVQCVERADALGQALAAQGESLRRAGFRVQVPIRPDCTLSFVHPEGAEGPRYRLRGFGTERELVGGGSNLHVDTLMERAMDDPRAFSSSALLRPALQDHLFPRAAYIAGPGEASYFAQLAPIYEELGVARGRLIPRMRARYLSASCRERLSQWNVQGDVADAKSWTSTLAEASAVREEAADLRARLANMVSGDPRDRAKASASIEHALSGWVERTDRRLLQRTPDLQRDYQAVLRELQPLGTPQERTLCVADRMAHFGDTLLGALDQAYEPLGAAICDIDLPAPGSADHGS